MQRLIRKSETIKNNSNKLYIKGASEVSTQKVQYWGKIMFQDTWQSTDDVLISLDIKISTLKAVTDWQYSLMRNL